MKSKIMKYIPLFLLSVFLLIACNNNKVFKTQKELGNSIWTYSDVFRSVIPVKDIAEPYDIYFSIEHTENYPFQNIYLRISDDFHGKINIDTINFDLYDKYGIAKGKKHGKNYNVSILLRKSFKFKNPGDYKIEIEQFTRTDSLEGVTGLGFSLNAAK